VCTFFQTRGPNTNAASRASTIVRAAGDPRKVPSARYRAPPARKNQGPGESRRRARGEFEARMAFDEQGVGTSRWRRVLMRVRSGCPGNGYEGRLPRRHEGTKGYRRIPNARCVPAILGVFMAVYAFLLAFAQAHRRPVRERRPQGDTEGTENDAEMGLQLMRRHAPSHVPVSAASTDTTPAGQTTAHAPQPTHRAASISGAGSKIPPAMRIA